jgi:hypothetical protein
MVELVDRSLKNAPRSFYIATATSVKDAAHAPRDVVPKCKFGFQFLKQFHAELLLPEDNCYAIGLAQQDKTLLQFHGALGLDSMIQLRSADGDKPWSRSALPNATRLSSTHFQ